MRYIIVNFVRHQKQSNVKYIIVYFSFVENQRYITHLTHKVTVSMLIFPSADGFLYQMKFVLFLLVFHSICLVMDDT